MVVVPCAERAGSLILCATMFCNDLIMLRVNSNNKLIC